MPDGFITSHGGYANLLSYRNAEIVYDATVFFCQRFLSKRDRTYDQMIQAARSGKQNIIICLIHQTSYLLDRQIRRLERDFLEQGGLRERMTQARLAERDKQRKNRVGRS